MFLLCFTACHDVLLLFMDVMKEITECTTAETGVFPASRISCNCHIGMQQSIQSDSRSNQLFNQLLVEEGTQNRIGVIR